MARKQVVSSKFGEFFLLSINAAGVAILPVLTIGYTLYIAAGLWGSIAVITASCIILYFVSASIMRIALQYHVSTIEIAIEYFGKRGAPLCATVIGAAFCGWFIWQLNFAVDFIKYVAFVHIPFISNFSALQIAFFFGVVFLLLTASGKFGIRFFAVVLVPILVITAIITSVLLLRYVSQLHSLHLRSYRVSLSTLSILLNSFAAHTLSTPTFYRFASSPQAALRSLKIVYFFLLPLFCCIGGIIGSLSPYENIFELFESARGIWPIVLIIYSFLGCWAACTFNLYYGADAFSYLFGLEDTTPVVIFMWVACMGIIAFDTQFGMPTTNILGTMAIGTLTIIMTRAAISGMSLNRDSPTIQNGNCIALICSNIAALCTSSGYIEITGIPFFDAMLVAFFVCAYFSIFKHVPRRQRWRDPSERI